MMMCQSVIVRTLYPFLNNVTIRINMNKYTIITVPPSAVRMERRTRKLPSLSARKPASGGVKMKRMGMMALITEASCTLIPRY